MNNVVTFQMPKAAYIQIRISEQIKADLQIAAELRGASMSGLLHQFIVQTIREEKELSPEAFKSEPKMNAFIPEPKSGAKVATAKLSSHPSSKEMIRQQLIGEDEIQEIERRIKPKKRKTG
jgi:antitoxin component of RelBE/YafQ-DinJ toxin-antitoxin module